MIPFTLVWSLEALLYADLRTGAVLRRALAGLIVNAAASVALVIALGIEGRPLGVFVGVVVQLASCSTCSGMTRGSSCCAEDRP